MKTKIMHDVYEISKRIKYIDRGYYIVYDTLKHKFEVHNANQLGDTFCVNLPYSYLDERTLVYIYETNTSNIDKIIDKLDSDNTLRENAEKRRVFSQLNDTIEDSIKETI